MFLTEKILDYINPNLTILCLGYNEQLVKMLRREGFFNRLDIFGDVPRSDMDHHWLKVRFINDLPVKECSYDLVIYFNESLGDYDGYFNELEYTMFLARCKVILVIPEISEEIHKINCAKMISMDRSENDYKIVVLYKKNDNHVGSIDPYGDGKKH